MGRERIWHLPAGERGRRVARWAASGSRRSSRPPRGRWDDAGRLPTRNCEVKKVPSRGPDTASRRGDCTRQQVRVGGLLLLCTAVAVSAAHGASAGTASSVGRATASVEDSSWSCAFSVPGPDSLVRAMLVSGDTLVLGGAFDHVGPTPAPSIALYDGKDWHTVGGGLPGGEVYCLAWWEGQL